MRTRAPEGEGEARAWTLAEGRDRWAFLLLAGFCVQIYAAPAEWIPAFVPLRLALSLSLGALGLLVLEHAGRRVPLQWDGVRGWPWWASWSGPPPRICGPSTGK